jgi:hypothetical protein
VGKVLGDFPNLFPVHRITAADGKSAHPDLPVLLLFDGVSTPGVKEPMIKQIFAIPAKAGMTFCRASVITLKQTGARAPCNESNEVNTGWRIAAGITAFS